MSFTRADRSHLADWWFTIDRAVIAIVLMLVMTGLVLSLAASPAVAVRKGFGSFHFVYRHVLFAGLGLLVMLAMSLLSPRQVRRLSLLVLAGAMLAMAWVIAASPEVNGARRWVRLAGFSLQPSEVMKPAFVVITAWLLAESRRRNDIPALGIAIGLLATLAALLLLQPDVGQTMLAAALWGIMFFLAGHRVLFAGIFAATSVAGLGLAYWSFEYVRRRVDRFLDPSSGDNFQVDRALQSFAEGGLLGRGPGEGTIKAVLPDAHTDFIFAVIGEEYGALACVALIVLFAAVVVRAFRSVADEPDLFTRLAVVGLALLIALQAVINMSVNVGLLPAKGMTLPLISSGGSSQIAVSMTFGLLLALMRRRPDASRVKKPQLRTKVETGEVEAT